MNRLLGIILIIGIALGLTSCSGKLSTPDMVKHTSNSTVALVFYDEENDDELISDIRVYCSGIWVDDTHILTAHHCVKVAQQEQQRKQDAREKESAVCGILEVIMGKCDLNIQPVHKIIPLKGVPVHYIVEKEVTGVGREPTAWHLGSVQGYDEDHDLALVEVSGPTPEHEVAELAKDVPAKGEAVTVVGHPKGYYWTYLQGTVSGYLSNIPHNKDKGPYLQVQVPAYFGNSGGGAFDSYGKLIGMADLLIAVPSETLFVPVESIRDFLQAEGVLKK